MRTQILSYAIGLIAASSLSVSADPINIFTIGDTTTDNGAILTVAEPKGSGSGNFEAFVRWGPNKSGLSQGMNAGFDGYLDNNPPAGDNPPKFTRNVQASSVQVNEDGYYLFRFDAGNPGGAPVTLQEIKLFTSPTKLGTSGELDALRSGVPTWLASNSYNVKDQSGQGIGDLFLEIPQSLINDSDWLYLYTESGGTPYPDSGTFNQWSFLARSSPPPSVPDGGATVLLLSIALASFGGLRRKLG